MTMLTVGNVPAVDDELQYQVTTRDGISFDSRDPLWPISAKQIANVGRLRDCFGSTLLDGLNGTLRSLVGRYSASTFAHTVVALHHHHSTMRPKDVIKHWDALNMRNYRAKLLEEFGHEGYLIRIRTFLKYWKALRHPGVPDDCAKALKAMSLKGAETGRAVRTFDADEGPLTQEELQQLTQNVYRAADDGHVEIEELSLAIFHIVTGRRPSQSAALKCLDVDGSRKGDEDEQLWLLHVPRAKQQGHAFRQTRRSVYLIEVYFALFEAQRELVYDQMRRLLADQGFALQPSELEHLLAHLPLYPSWKCISETLAGAAELRERSYAEALATLRLHAEGQFWHLTTEQITKRLQATSSEGGTLGREGKPLIVGGTRLRYTKGTDLARQGVGLAALAWLLDHSNLHSAGIYIANLPEHAAQVSEAMAGSIVLNRVASLFRGEVVDSEAAATAGDDPLRSRIHYKGEGAATCGVKKNCGMGDGIPRACYTCERFQPWLDGPHESLLSDLLRERSDDAETLGENHPITKRRNKTIIGVMIVIQRCNARRQELAAAAAPRETGA